MKRKVGGGEGLGSSVGGLEGELVWNQEKILSSHSSLSE